MMQHDEAATLMSVTGMNCVKCRLIWALVVGASLLVASGRAPAAITVDGNLDDWNITVRTGERASADVTAPYSGGTIIGVPGTTQDYGKTKYGNGVAGSVAGLLGFVIEDSNDVITSSYEVGEDFGGQNYDAEGMFAATNGTHLLLAILSGQRPDNGFSEFAPGDIRIRIGDGRTFGVEVGGYLAQGVTSSNNAADNGDTRIVEGDPGTFFVLNSSGITTGYSTDPPAGDGLHRAGTLWQTDDTDWWTEQTGGGSNPPFDRTQLQLTGGDQVNAVIDYVFTRDNNLDTDGETIDSSSAANKQHSVIELSIPWSALGLAPNQTLTIEWRPSCGNDNLVVPIVYPHSPPPVPEPGSIAIWGGIAVAALFSRRLLHGGRSGSR
jgi:hypothetical protein